MCSRHYAWATLAERQLAAPSFPHAKVSWLECTSGNLQQWHATQRHRRTALPDRQGHVDLRFTGVSDT